MVKKDKELVVKQITVVLVTIFILFCMCKGLFNRSVWYDEAMQFWIALGCDPDLTSTRGGINDLIKLNQNFNHDPGGYSLILYFWSIASTGTMWLRSLSLMFFFLSILLIYKTSRIIFNSKLHSYACCLTPFFIDSLLYLATEIRPYSMECLSCAFNMFSICYIYKKNKDIPILILVTTMSILMTSRYSSIIGTSIAIFLIILIIFQKRSFRLKRFFMTIAPFFSCFALIYIYSLKEQNPSIQTPSYIVNNFLFNWQNILFLISIPLSVFIALKIHNKCIKQLTLYVVILNIAFLTLSLLNIHPADICSKYCISMIFSNLILYSFFTCDIILNLKSIFVNKVSFGIIILFILLQYKSMGMRYAQEDIELEYIVKSKEKYIFIDKDLSPIVKYHLHHGKLSNILNKETLKIDFEKQIKHNIKKTVVQKVNMLAGKSIDYEKYDILVLKSQSVIDSKNWLKRNQFYFTKGH